MDVRYSTEQRALRDSVVKVVADLGPRTVADLDDEERSAKLDAAVTAAGWRELRTGDDRGPLASGVEAAIVAEEMSRGLADTAFLGPTVAAELRRRAGAPPATHAETVAMKRDLTSLPVDSSDAVVVDALGAASALAVVSTAHGYALGHVRVDRSSPTTDLTRSTAPLTSPGHAPIDNQQRPLDDDDLAAVTALGLALSSAELVGSMRGAVELATSYAKDRRQYGNPIGSYQAVQHLLADAHVAAEGSRSVALHAAWAVDALDPHDALVAAAIAKAYLARAARTVCETAIQVHGGIGNTWECLAHVHLRRALLSTDLFGGTGASLERLLAHRGIGAGHGLR